MKKILIVLLALGSLSAFSYTQWQDYTPSHIFTKYSLLDGIQKKITILTKGSINTCNDIFEGNQYRTKVLSCLNGNLDLKVEYKNKVDCDAGEDVIKKLNINLETQCLNNFSVQPGYSTVTINGKLFKNH
jgi:hypothetical protein